ncbi:MAG: CarD family transcriptional regulator [Proteobacteria bacterium]|nr:CarD family transcriptional regulator [Pseudomonadota bacterium]
MSHEILFSIGDTVVYPTRGVGCVKDIETQDISGHVLQVYVIQFDQDQLTIRLPLTRAQSSGLRKLSAPDVFHKTSEVLKAPPQIRKIMWSKRAQEFEAKINSGNPLAIAEVLRDLYKIQPNQEQSYSERQIFQAALIRLAREKALVENTTLSQATQEIECSLSSKL